MLKLISMDHLCKTSNDISSVQVMHCSLYLHWYGHSSNLAVADTMKNSSTMSNTLDHTQKDMRINQIFFSQGSYFSNTKRWTYTKWPMSTKFMSNSLDSTCSISWKYLHWLHNLTATWEEAIEDVKDTGIKAIIGHVASKMKEFDFLFGLMFEERIIQHTDRLNKTLQATPMTAVQAYDLALLCNKYVLLQIRKSECFTGILLHRPKRLLVLMSLAYQKA